MSKYILILIGLVFSKAEAQTSALAVADSLYAVGDYSQAIKTLERTEPKTEQVYLKLARAFRAQGNLKEAGANYEIVLKKNPERILTQIDHAKLLMKTGEWNKADSIFSRLAMDYPKNAGFQYQLGLIKEQQQDNTVIAYFKNTIQLEPKHQDALFKLAKNELQGRKYGMAINYSLIGLRANPANVSLRSILAQSYYSQKFYEKAIREFEKILELGQGNEFVHSRLGFSYYQLSDFLNAIDQYKRALNFEDKNSDTHYNLGKLYAITGDLEKSEIHLLMAVLIKKQPVDAEFLSLGLTYKLQKDYKKALEYFNNSLEENSNNERALYERAIAADNYFEDLQTRINYYIAYLNKYEAKGNEDLIYLAKTRLKDIRKDLHLLEK
ncbi:MAG: tetratricopeptide repeat protein [Bacteroidota bacterium]